MGERKPALEWRPDDDEGGFEADVTVGGLCIVELDVGLLDYDEEDREPGVGWTVHGCGTYDCGYAPTLIEAQLAAEAYALETLEAGAKLLRGRK